MGMRILLYLQVYTASGRTINRAASDQEATNGRLHVLNGVMLPPTGSMQNYVNMSEVLSELWRAVNTSNLEETLPLSGARLFQKRVKYM